MCEMFVNKKNSSITKNGKPLKKENIEDMFFQIIEDAKNCDPPFW